MPGACSRFQDLNGINETLTIKKKRLFTLTRVISYFQFHGNSSVCPKDVLVKMQNATNYFIYSNNNPPIPSALATRNQNQGGYNHINIESRLDCIAISSFRDFINGSLPPPLQTLMHLSLLTFLSLLVPEEKMSPYRLSPTIVIDALISLNLKLKLRIKNIYTQSPKPPLPPSFAHAPRMLHIWLRGILETLPNIVNCRRRYNPTSHLDIRNLRQSIEENLNSQPIFHNSAIVIPADAHDFLQSPFLNVHTLSDLRTITRNKVDLHQRVPEDTIARMKTLKDTTNPMHLVARPYNRDAFNTAWSKIDFPQSREYLNSTECTAVTQSPTSISNPLLQAVDRVLIDTALYPLTISLPTPKVKEEEWCSSPLHLAKTSVYIKTANSLAFHKVKAIDKFPRACKYWQLHDNSISFNIGTYTKALNLAMNCGLNDMVKDSVLALWHHSSVPLVEGKSTRFTNLPEVYTDPITLKETNWSTCINCKGCNNPLHYYFKCPVMIEFWALMNPTLTTLINNRHLTTLFNLFAILCNQPIFPARLRFHLHHISEVTE